MAKNFLDNLSEEVNKGFDEKLQMGLYPSSPKFGYGSARVNGKSVLIIKQNEAIAVKRIFELFTTGQETHQSICQKLRAEKVDVVAETTFYPSKVHAILNNPLYYGDFRWNGKIYKGVHEPIITKGLWNEARAIQAGFKNKTQVKRYNTLKFFLKGLMVCGECGRQITAEKKKGKYVYYRCTRHGTNCQQKPVKEEELLPQIESIINTVHIPKEIATWVTEGLKQSLKMKADTIDIQVKALKSSQTKLENRLSQIYEDKLDKKITEEFYDSKFAEYQRELISTNDQLEKYSRATLDYYSVGIQILELSKTALRLYKDGTLDEKLELLGFLLSNFILTDGIIVPDWKKPFGMLVKYTTHSDWQGYQDLNSNPKMICGDLCGRAIRI
jgi:hypothetical protein